MQEEKTTPMMAQWEMCKKKVGNAILLFRLGDFYEAFYEDAKRASEALELTLTKRQDVPMSGIPAHTVDGYVDRLVGKGYSVAIAEQMEDPAKTKGMVKRDVVRIVSPGTLVTSNLLKEKVHNYFVSVCLFEKKWALAALDLACNVFKTSEFESWEHLLNELHRLKPRELLVSDKVEVELGECAVTKISEWLFDISYCSQVLKDHFQVKTLDGFGMGEKKGTICASGALLHHIKKTHLYELQHLTKVEYYHPGDTLYLDGVSIENLQLDTLLNVLDKTLTPMGGRLLREWTLRPLLNIEEIYKRQEAIKALQLDRRRTTLLLDTLPEIKDIDRLMARVSLGVAGPKDLLSLAKSLEASLRIVEGQLDNLPGKLLGSLKQPSPFRLSDGNVIADGYNATLDEYRNIANNTRNYLIEYQNKVREETGIKTLKIGFNRMFGYYIEVSRGQSHLMPDTFERRQTLVNQERYVSPLLREFEQKVMEAEDKIQELEKELYEGLVKMILPYHAHILEISAKVARVDTLLSLAIVAEQNNYVAPVVDNSRTLHIKEGRHPVIEALIPRGSFVPNDSDMDDESRMYVITGPNMAGKSTYIRQVALIVLMAQMGSFVPAKEATIGLIDRIFTRIGASDDLTKGQSTFMKEMTETANILNNVTESSLVILDEIGRGTSTYDGISIAWSCAEYLLGPHGKKAKTLFATHYFELTELEVRVPGAKNYHSAIQETDEGIYFLRKIVPGGADKSYGIHVAKLAGIPQVVVNRAHEILLRLERKPKRESKTPLKEQLLLF